jgi:hypothetical protein
MKPSNATSIPRFELRVAVASIVVDVTTIGLAHFLPYVSPRPKRPPSGQCPGHLENIPSCDFTAPVGSMAVSIPVAGRCGSA